MTELDLAKQIAAGGPSPQRFGGSVLLALRVSGTGLADRPSLGERTFRDPLVWLGAEMQARVAGLPIILNHPSDAALDQDEFAARSVGAVLYPYCADRNGIEDSAGDDLWAVARVFLDDDAVDALGESSTSPCVLFAPGETSTITIDGEPCLVEGPPTAVDHCAIVVNGAGVWDKGGPVSGIRLERKLSMPSEQEDQAAREDAARKADAGGTEPDKRLTDLGTRKADAGEEPNKILAALDAITKMCDGLSKRMDAMDEGMMADRARRDSEHDTAEAEQERRRGETARIAADQERERKESGEKAGAQARADAIYGEHGERAPPPLAGETLRGYRARLARGVQRHCADFKGIALHNINDAATFDAIENRIYADAKTAARNPETIPGVLREITRVDPASGQRITSFYGDHTFIRHMTSPSRRLVGIRMKSLNE